MTYAEKLLDPRWQKMRLKILERDNFMCQSCADKTKTLHVHHCWYKIGLDPWDYPEQMLFTLCCECHKELTEVSKKIDSDIIARLFAPLTDGFMKTCLLEVLSKYDVHGLILRLWELSAKPEEVLFFLSKLQYQKNGR